MAYTYGGKSYSQEQLDAIAQKATPSQRELMNKQFGTAYPRAAPPGQIIDANSRKKPDVKINTEVMRQYTPDYNPKVPTQISGTMGTEAKQGTSTNPGTSSPLPSSPTNDAQNAFESGYAQYMKAQQDVYGIETGRQMQDFANRGADNARGIQRNRDDYARFTGQEIKDTGRALALNNVDFARSLTNASRSYGQRGIMGAGIQKASLGEGVGQFADSQSHFKTLSQRRLDTAGENMNRAETDYSTNMGRLDTAKTNYTSDRSAGSKVLETQLQQQGDSLYNQTQSQSAKLSQQQTQQAYIDKLYGRTPKNNVAVPMRIGGKYF